MVARHSITRWLERLLYQIWWGLCTALFFLFMSRYGYKYSSFVIKHIAKKCLSRYLTNIIENNIKKYHQINYLSLKKNQKIIYCQNNHQIKNYH